MGTLRRKVFTLILALALILTLAACQCKHEWAEADCLNPRTCTKCGETEGEPLGHCWSNATCEAPEACTNCGLTQGEALGHTWKEANYQDPETCTTCGATQGQPLEADFEKYGLEINLWENKHYSEKTETSSTYHFNDPKDGFPYVTTCNNDTTKKTTGALYLCNYRIFQSDETHQAVDGYEWRAFDVEIEFSDENAQKYAPTCRFGFTDYYHMEKSEESTNIKDYVKEITDETGIQWEYLLESADMVEVGEVSFHGETYSIAGSYENLEFGSWWTHGDGSQFITFSGTYCFCVPIGYDGIVYFFSDYGIEAEGLYPYEWADENTLFFRLEDHVLNMVTE